MPSWILEKKTVERAKALGERLGIEHFGLKEINDGYVSMLEEILKRLENVEALLAGQERAAARKALPKGKTEGK